MPSNKVTKYNAYVRVHATIRNDFRYVQELSNRSKEAHELSGFTLSIIHDLGNPDYCHHNVIDLIKYFSQLQQSQSAAYGVPVMQSISAAEALRRSKNKERPNVILRYCNDWVSHLEFVRRHDCYCHLIKIPILVDHYFYNLPANDNEPSEGG